MHSPTTEPVPTTARYAFAGSRAGGRVRWSASREPSSSASACSAEMARTSRSMVRTSGVRDGQRPRLASLRGGDPLHDQRERLALGGREEIGEVRRDRTDVARGGAYDEAAALRGEADEVGAPVGGTDVPLYEAAVDEPLDGACEPALREQRAFREVARPQADLRRPGELYEEVMLAEGQPEPRAGLPLEGARRGRVSQQEGLPGLDLRFAETSPRPWNRLRTQLVDCTSN